MPAPIAILGWGSLLWDLDDLAPWTDRTWRLGSGPRLPMEFSRISPKRKLGLVVCLDPLTGVACTTHVIQSVRQTLPEAVADLAARERAPLHRIGWADRNGDGHSRMPEIVVAVAAWCRDTGRSGAVWTDLEPNFRDHTGLDFSVDQGIAYLQTLRGDSLDEAHRYIRNAPFTTRTPLRRKLSRTAWWRNLTTARRAGTGPGSQLS